MKIVFKMIERGNNLVVCLLIPRIGKKYPTIANQLFLYVDEDYMAMSEIEGKDNRRWYKMYGISDSLICSFAPGWLLDSVDMKRVHEFCNVHGSEFNDIFEAQAKITKDIYEEEF